MHNQVKLIEMSKLIQNTKAVKLWFESKKSLTYNLKISFLIKESKKTHRNKFNYDVSVGKVKKLNKGYLIPEY